MAQSFEEKIKDFTPNTQSRIKQMKKRDPNYDPFKSNQVPTSDKQIEEWENTVKEGEKWSKK